LSSHTDIIRILIRINDTWFASGSDDGTIAIWDSETAERVMVLNGHLKPITCLLLVSPNILVSGSSDRSLMFWDLMKGNCIKVNQNCHESSIKCLIALSANRFCSGGNDINLFVWENTGELVGPIDRQEEANINCMLAMANKIIVGSSSSILFVYDSDQLKFSQLYTYHKESITCLSKINDNLFGSGSIDGRIIIWKMIQNEGIEAHRRFTTEKLISNSTDNFRFSPHAINYLNIFNQSFLTVCIGNSFEIINIFTSESMMYKTDAHESTIYSIIPINDGKWFLTCGADSQIKLWGSKKEFPSHDDATEPERSKTNKPHSHQAICIGDMAGHMDQVKVLLKLSETSFVSGGYDNLLILWRNGDEQTFLRNLFSAEFVLEIPRADNQLARSMENDYIIHHKFLSTNSAPAIYSGNSITFTPALTSDDAEDSQTGNTQDSEGNDSRHHSSEDERPHGIDSRSPDTLTGLSLGESSPIPILRSAELLGEKILFRQHVGKIDQLKQSQKKVPKVLDDS